MKKNYKKIIVCSFFFFLLAICMIGFASSGTTPLNYQDDTVNVLSNIRDRRRKESARMRKMNEKKKKKERENIWRKEQAKREALKALKSNASTSSTSTDINVISSNVSFSENINNSKEQVEKLITSKDVYEHLIESEKEEQIKDVFDGINKATKGIAEIVHASKGWNNLTSTEKDMAMYTLTKDLLIAAISCTGYGAAAEAAFEVIDMIIDLCQTGEEPLSEIAILSGKIDRKFDETFSKINDVLSNLDAMAVSADERQAEILSAIKDEAFNIYNQSQLEEFYSGTNFSYKKLKNCLYGCPENVDSNTNEAYVYLLNNDIQNGANNSLYYYDLLFKKLLNDTNGLYQAIVPTDASPIKKSIIRQYYSVLTYYENEDNVSLDADALNMTVDFAYDVKNTYEFACKKLADCYSYAAINLYKECCSIAKSDSELETLLNTKVDTISNLNYNQILSEIEKLEERFNRMEAALVADIAYIYGIGGSYLYTDKYQENGETYAYLNGNTHINIADGQTVFTNLMADSINELFGLSGRNYHFYFGYTDPVNLVNYEEEITESSEIGVVLSSKIKEYKDLSPYVSLKYIILDGDGAELYSSTLYNVYFDYEATTEYSGGNGTVDYPYLISNKEQLKLFLTNPDLDACYKLISDIDLSEYLNGFNPVGTIDKPFNGFFEGNGHKINNLIVNSNSFTEETKTKNPVTGLFGYVGTEGAVLDLELVNPRIISDGKKDHVSYANLVYYIGTIAGFNEGIISNCKVTSTSGEDLIYVDREKTSTESSDLSIYVGGIVGYNNYNGIIEYCVVDNSRITVYSTMNLHAESETENVQSFNVAGITAYTEEPITNCAVKEAVIHVEVINNSKNNNDVAPYINGLIGGLIGNQDDGPELINDCYSNVIIDMPTLTLTHSGRLRGGNVNLLTGDYYPIFIPLTTSETLTENTFEYYKYYDLAEYYYYLNNDSTANNQFADIESQYTASEKLLKLTGTDRDKLRVKVKSYLFDKRNEVLGFQAAFVAQRIHKSYNEDNYRINTNLDDVTVLSHKDTYENGVSFNKSDFDFKVNGVPVNVEILGVYGFNPFHEMDNDNPQDVIVFFYASVDGDRILYSGSTSVVVKKDTIVKTELYIPTGNEVYRGLSDSELVSFLIENGAVVKHYYKSGKIIQRKICDSETITIVSVDGNDITSRIGNRSAIFTDKTGSYTINIKVCCRHELIVDHVVPSTCITNGYTCYKCKFDDCDYSFNSDYKKVVDHNYITEAGKNPTCHECGYTDRIYCEWCGLEKQQAKELKKLPHEYKSLSKTENGFSPKLYHYCDNNEIKHYTTHDFAIREFSQRDDGTIEYLFECTACNYSYVEVDDNILFADGNNNPRLYVTNGYYREKDKTVSVYVCIENIDKYSSCIFTLRYSYGLSLDRVEYPTGVSGNMDPSDGRISFVVDLDKRNYDYSSYLVKVTFNIDSLERQYYVTPCFELRDDIDNFGHTYTLYGGVLQGNGDNPKHVICCCGIIRQTINIPGDISGNGIVDADDITQINNYFTSPKALNDSQKIAADVDLDGRITLNDKDLIQRYIDGEYGLELLDPLTTYKVLINMNGFIAEQYCDSLELNYYEHYIKHGGKWITLLSSDYECISRPGYTFLGWFDSLVGGNRIDLNSTASYFRTQRVQTLYAHWQRNTIKFSEFFDNRVFDENQNCVYSLENVPESFKVSFRVDDSFIDEYPEQTLTRWLIGWTDQFGNMYPIGHKIDLSQGNFATVIDGIDCVSDDFDATYGGIIKLTPNWGTYSFTSPTETRSYRRNIEKWLFGNEKVTNDNITSIIEDLLKKGVNELILDGESVGIDYEVIYKGKGSVDNKYAYAQSLNIVTSTSFTVAAWNSSTGYSHKGWKSTNGIIYSSNYSVEDVIKNFLYNGKLVFESIDEANVYTITIKGIDASKSSNDVYQTEGLYTFYYKYDDGCYTSKACNTRISSLDLRNHNSNFDILGFSLYNDSANGHSGITSKSISYINQISADGKIKDGFKVSTDTTYYAICKPHQITLSFLYSDSCYILQNNDDYESESDGIIVKYSTSNDTYTLSPGHTPGSKKVTLKQYAQLDAGKYVMHLNCHPGCIVKIILTGPESKTLQFAYTNFQSFEISNSGMYHIQVQAVNSSSFSFDEFFISREYTKTITAYYNEKLPNITLPSSKYYKYALKVNGKYVYNSVGESSTKCTYTSNQTLKFTRDSQTYNAYYVSSVSDWNGIPINCTKDIYILRDINGVNGNIKSLDTLNSSKTLEGNGFILYNVIIGPSNCTVSSGEENYGLVNVNNGTIKNLIISQSLFKFEGKNTSNESGQSFHVGGIAGKNCGVIMNCQVIGTTFDTSIDSNHSNKNESTWKTLDVGGIAGISTGTISECKTHASKIKATCRVIYDKQCASTKCGGIVGVVKSGSISNCSVINTSIIANASTEGHMGNHGELCYAEAGKVAGRTYKTSYMSNNTYDSKCTVNASANAYGWCWSASRTGDLYACVEEND